MEHCSNQYWMKKGMQIFFVLFTGLFLKVYGQTSITKLKDTIAVIDNGVLTLKLDLTRGGAISYLSLSTSTRNIVNISDEGRYIQQSYYAGKGLNRQAEGQSKQWSPWPWNPIQVGDYNRHRAKILDFKKNGKFIVAYGDYISQKAYHVASVADKIYCHPMGMFEWQGMSVEYVFFKGLIDRLEVKPQIFYAGKYKSATEPFRETAMTPANKEQTSEWLNGIYGKMVEDVSSSRKLNKDSMRLLAQIFALDKPEKAVKAGLIDGLKYDDELRDEIRKRVNLSKEKSINFIK